MRLVVTHRAPEQLAPLRFDALAAKVREPLPLGAAARTILAGAVGIHLDGHGTSGVCLVSGVVIDLAAQLVRSLAVHASRLAPPVGCDLAQAFEQEHAAGVPGAHSRNAARRHLRGILIHAPHMPPQLLIAVLALDGGAHSAAGRGHDLAQRASR